MAPCVFAIAAHPDDIEFGMAGTMLLLRRAGWDLHAMNVADGSCGSLTMGAAETAAVRLAEAQAAAERLGAVLHPPLAPDLRVIYSEPLLRRLASVVRDVQPDIVLLPSLTDYMEDHTETARLGVTAAFSRAMPNFPVDPDRAPFAKPVAVYHAQPHGHRDALNRFVTPGFVVDVGGVLDEKVALLAEHRSQFDMLGQTQGMSSLRDTLRDFAREMGSLTGVCEYGEGWRRHNPRGFCDEGADPLREALRGDVYVVRETG